MTGPLRHDGDGGVRTVRFDARPATDQTILDRWERREETVYRIVPYGTLLVAGFLTVIVGGQDAAQLGRTLGLAAATALWTLWMVTLHPTWAQTRRALMALYYVVLLLFMASLVVRAPWFGLFAFTGYLHAILVLRGKWRTVGVMATAVITATSQYGGLPHGGATALIGYAVVVGFNFTLGGAIMWFGWITQEQNDRRKQSLAELAETNRRLEATLEENRGLHALLLTQAREAGVLDERQRMAQEIHDTLAQGLIGIITQIQAADHALEQVAERRIGAAPGSVPLPRGATAGNGATDPVGLPGVAQPWRRHLDAAAQLARDSLSEARRSVRALRPEQLESARLPEAVAGVAQRWSALNQVRADVETTGTARALHPQVEATLLRAAQEALANVARHARAARVMLTLSYMEDQVTLDVRDDGVGFDAAAACARAQRGVGDGDGDWDGDTGGDAGGGFGGGFGLTAMRQRIDRIGGRLEIESEPGGGTALSASVPAR